MTTDEFERILAALKHMRSWSINGEHYVPLAGIIQVIHSNLNHDDRGLYQFDFPNNTWEKKAPGPAAE